MSLNFTADRRLTRTTGLSRQDEFTYMARVQIPLGSFSSTFDILSEYSSGSRYRFRMVWSNGQIFIYLQNVRNVLIFFPSYSVTQSGVQGAQANVWYHVAATLQNRTITLFVDGIQYSSSSHSNNNLSGSSGTLGALQTGDSNFSNYFRGSIKDIRVYDTALDVNTIQTIATLNEADQIHGNIISRWTGMGSVGSSVATVSDIAESNINLSPVGGTLFYGD
jgi:hypothetical protein